MTPGPVPAPALPPHSRLEAVLEGLARHLPVTHGVLVDAEELAAGRAALVALADAAARRRVAGALDETEAAWMADRLMAAWARIGEPAPAAKAGIIAPAALWMPGPQAAVTLTLAVDGMVEGWQAHWPPGAEVLDETRAVVEIDAPAGTLPATHRIAARAIGRLATADGSPGQREVLVAEATITLRRPVPVRHAGGRALMVRDQTGAPAAGLMLRLDGRARQVPANGILALETPLGPGTEIEIEGVAVRVLDAIREVGDGAS